MLRSYNNGLVKPYVTDRLTIWNNLSNLMHSRDNKWVALSGNEHNILNYGVGNTIPINSVDWSANYYVRTKITGVRITGNGNIIVFSDDTRVHYSTDLGITYNLCNFQNQDGTPFVFHTPVDANYPGSYFSQYLDNYAEENGVIVIGTYSNVF